jgi:hypothetical protein
MQVLKQLITWFLILVNLTKIHNLYLSRTTKNKNN